MEGSDGGITVSFRDIITGQGMVEGADDLVLGEGGECIMEDSNGDITIEEEVIRGYECPKFIFSAEEEERMQRPWRRGVIVKLLGRRIGYKALENRLNQMWVRKGVISIIDLSNDYYLVAFSHEDDKKAAMANGPWFIYDHYLTVKDWKPNFQPDCDTISEVAVWVRIAGLPIEYYCPKALTRFGNRIGRAIKIDRTTTKQERGKYARICVAVNLAKPLLGMFQIDGSSYKIEYEGLHLLCLVCGRYGHYKEGCSFKSAGKESEEDRSMENGRKEMLHVGEGSGLIGNTTKDDGPWKVVQKQRKGKKVAEGRKDTAPVKFNVKSAIGGSRFLALGNMDHEVNSINVVEKDKEKNDKGDMENPDTIASICGSQSQKEIINISSTAGGKERDDAGNNIKYKSEINEKDTRTWLDLIGEHNKVVGHANTRITVGSGGRRQQQENQKKKGNNLTTRGGIRNKDKNGGISTSGVEGLLGNFHIGESLQATTYDTFNLTKKGVGKKGGKNYMENQSSMHGSRDSLAKSHAKEGIDMEEPPDTAPNIRKNNKFNFGDKSYILEPVIDIEVTSCDDNKQDDVDEEIVCETL
ncbi:uncharacterized protein LOC131638194 [Vicia villosa]|uniref:uncharacterized protein LOC131638194 n=1 Tax=Vicia villosa TaxID=3911 RepID=UPI00273CB558|nr:uncharacterized protein LOC131638194 [Vicia villosa]